MYKRQGYYGVKRTWDGVLKIGTNIKVIDGKSALDYAKNISTELKVELESFLLVLKTITLLMKKIIKLFILNMIIILTTV